MLVSKHRISPIELGILHDLGYQVAGTQSDDTIYGTPYNDTITPGGGSDYIDAGSGIDKVQYSGRFSEYTISGSSSHFFVTDKFQNRDGSDVIDAAERLIFTDKVVALDINGNAGQAYRLYQAALGRTPDDRGLASWIKYLDEGGQLNAVSQMFIDSQEFKAKYGALDNFNFVNQLYLKVLDRNGEATGINAWVDALNGGALTRAQVLIGFSESSENKANVIGQIQNGISYTEWWLA